MARPMMPLYLFVAAALAGCASIPAGNFQCASAAPAGKTAWFAGDWNTNYGLLHLDQAGSHVEGTYTDKMTGGAGSLTGTVSGAALRYDSAEGQWRASGSLVLCAGGGSIAG